MSTPLLTPLSTASAGAIQSDAARSVRLSGNVEDALKMPDPRPSRDDPRCGRKCLSVAYLRIIGAAQAEAARAVGRSDSIATTSARRSHGRSRSTRPARRTGGSARASSGAAPTGPSRLPVATRSCRTWTRGTRTRPTGPTRRAATEARACGWWLIPQRTVERARLLWRSAMRCAVTTGRGSAGDTDVLAVLNRWRESGHWRRIAARVWPRHPGPRKPRGRPRKRRGGRPARAPRGLP